MLLVLNAVVCYGDLNPELLDECSNSEIINRRPFCSHSMIYVLQYWLISSVDVSFSMLSIGHILFMYDDLCTAILADIFCWYCIFHARLSFSLEPQGSSKGCHNGALLLFDKIIC